jgi:hypothetical protein
MKAHAERFDANDRRLQERQEALGESIELLTHDIREMQRSFGELHRAKEQDAEHIRALVRIAEIHDRRLSHLEGEEG